MTLTTPLYERHRALGAKMLPFAGFEMPIQYPEGILAEHRRVREHAGLFDVSHMGEFWLEGEEAERFLDWLLPSPISRLAVGRAQYSFLCDETGGVLDDLIVYRLSDTRYLLCVNASNVASDWEWIAAKVKGFRAKLLNKSDETALLALQGPKARGFLDALFPSAQVLRVPRFGILETSWQGTPLLIARTGYTGEDGFEIFLDNAAAPLLWDAILDRGQGSGMGPIGLGARDSLRLEAALPLYGHELDRDHSPVESGLARFVDWDKKDYIGCERLVRDRETGGDVRLIAFRMEEPGIPRSDYIVGAGDAPIGKVTSGVFSPILGVGVGLAFASRAAKAEIGLDIWVEIRKKRHRALVVKPPFVRGARGE